MAALVSDKKIENKPVVLLNTAQLRVLDFAGKTLPALVSCSLFSAIHHIKMIKTTVYFDELLAKSFFFHPLKVDRHQYKEVPYVQVFLIDTIVLPEDKRVTDVTVVLVNDEYCARIKRNGKFYWCKHSKQGWKTGIVWSPGDNDQLFTGYISASRSALTNLPVGLQRHIAPFMAVTI
ncbi:MAG: hypothetical protein ABH827_03605 [bacterium]